jgi:hypothetical protein
VTAFTTVKLADGGMTSTDVVLVSHGVGVVEFGVTTAGCAVMTGGGPTVSVLQPGPLQFAWLSTV